MTNINDDRQIEWDREDQTSNYSEWRSDNIYSLRTEFTDYCNKSYPHFDINNGLTIEDYYPDEFEQYCKQEYETYCEGKQ